MVLDLVLAGQGFASALAMDIGHTAIGFEIGHLAIGFEIGHSAIGFEIGHSAIGFENARTIVQKGFVRSLHVFQE